MRLRLRALSHQRLSSLPRHLQKLPTIPQTKKNTTEFSQWCKSFTVESAAFATGLQIAGARFDLTNSIHTTKFRYR